MMWMGNRLRRPVGRLRLASYVEGGSLFLLVAVAMPLKYAAGRPEAVQVMGALHGAAFLIFCYVLAKCAWAGRWRWTEVAWAGFSAFVPLGFLLIRGLLARKDGATS